MMDPVFANRIHAVAAPAESFRPSLLKHRVRQYSSTQTELLAAVDALKGALDTRAQCRHALEIQDIANDLARLASLVLDLSDVEDFGPSGGP